MSEKPFAVWKNELRSIGEYGTVTPQGPCKVCAAPCSGFRAAWAPLNADTQAGKTPKSQSAVNGDILLHGRCVGYKTPDTKHIGWADVAFMLEELIHEASNDIAGAGDLEELEAVRVRYLGKKSRVVGLSKTLSTAPASQRRQIGESINAFKRDVGERIRTRRTALEDEALNLMVARETVDISLPVRPERRGSVHPISQTIDEAVEIFGHMGFVLADGPDIETQWNNFSALNIPEDHPARQEHDTFYMNAEVDGERLVLRTHTSSVQIRSLLDQGAPIGIVCPGRVYRSDYDATHSPMFHQIEGLCLGPDITMGHMKWVLEVFSRRYFQVEDLPIRFRPSYFPFTEPSAEVDIGFVRGNGEFRIGPGEEWLEVLGCGMVNEKVLENCGVDPSRYQGFAFGVGVERIAMLKCGIPDLRSFFESDLRWLRHFGFSAFNQPNMVLTTA